MRERERQTDRQTDRQRDIQTDRERKGGGERESKMKRYKHTCIHIYTHA